MSSAERIFELVHELPDDLKGQLLDFAEYLKQKATKRSDQMDAESHEWLDVALDDMNQALAAIEADIPPEELAMWSATVNSSGRPVRYDQETGILLEVSE